MYALKLHSDGKIEKVLYPEVKTVDDISVTQLNLKYKCDIFMKYMGGEGDDRLFMLMHDDNDFGGNLKKSRLPLNTTLQAYFPNSRYVGDVLLVHIDEKDKIIYKHFNIKILDKFVLSELTDTFDGEWSAEFDLIK